jgi:hypothetical protein
MTICITIFKIELEKHLGLGKDLYGLANEVQELDKACLYMLLPGTLLKMVRVLNNRKVCYGIDSEQELDYGTDGQIRSEPE